MFFLVFKIIAFLAPFVYFIFLESAVHFVAILGDARNTFQ